MPYADYRTQLQKNREYYALHKQELNRRRVQGKHTYVPKEGPPEFVCIDGEGIGKHEHKYTYLAASSGVSCSAWDTGLSTRECLEFCLRLRRARTVCCGFSLGYDFCMFFRDIDDSSLEILWKTGEVIIVLDKVFYKLGYRQAKWLWIARLRDIHYNSVKQKVEYKVEKSIKVWDVFGFFQCSFLKILEAEEWISASEMGKETLDLIAHMKESRDNFENISHEEIEFYCREEVRILQELMNRLARTLWDAGIPLRSWHGAGAISGYLLKEHKVRNTLVWDGLPEEVREASLCAYYGGRVELFRQGPVEAPIYDYDRVSAYPSVAIDLPDLSNGAWYHVPGGELNVSNPLYQHGLWSVEWNIPETHPFSWLAPFPQRGKDGCIYWVRTGAGWYHTQEVKEAVKIFGSYITVKRGVYYHDDIGRKPFSWIRQLLETRMEYKRKHDPRHIPLKLGGNSIYGKLAQGTGNDGHKPPYQNYYLAGLITSRTRADMLFALSHCSLRDVLCVATDGVFCTREIDELNISGDIGQWELKVINEPAFFAQAGVYFTPGKRHVRTRGFNPKSMDYGRLMVSWESTPEPSRQDIKLDYKERRFVGLGYAVSTGHWDEFRRWIERDRYLSFRTEPRKEHGQTEWDSMLLYPGEMACERVPYRAKEEYVKDVPGISDDTLDIIEYLDQPDYPIE